MIVGQFSTRRDAELAVEHLVQEYGLDRSRIAIEAQGDDNGAETGPGGADPESGDYGAQNARACEGATEVKVDCRSGQAYRVQEALRAAGAERLRLQ